MESSRQLSTRAVHISPDAMMPSAGMPARERPRRLVYHPWVLGPALMIQSAPNGPWTVEVADDSRLLPALARGWGEISRRIRRYRAHGITCRAAAALMTPADAEEGIGSRAIRAVPSEPGDHRPFRTRTRRPLEMYGWSLLIPSRRMPGVAIVDPHDQFPDLPAFFELPRELIDRTEYLAAHGIASRPLALVTAVGDFERGVDGRWHNRFAPAARFDAARVA